MKRIKVAILDYEVGNHSSVKNCLDRLGFITYVASDISDLQKADLLMLPGVGAFHTAMSNLQRMELADYLKKWVIEGRPLLGICLGMQVFSFSSTEGTLEKGLAMIEGNVRSLSEQNTFHIGWNEIKLTQPDSFFSKFDGGYFYFNHSFAYEADTEGAVSNTFYGRSFPSIVKHGMVVGLQFHPEKSQDLGKELLSGLIREMVHGF
ncbi:imidazole glycerol phosphate synthase subunit HisH [Leptospira sp. 201903070]|uniref:Imidazole glycerol phosphate synthase subunit HisH n=1 Tax=Leptospira ainlahdjerensis TaxID=2810033 RepID=A0ABS2UAC6_9LEPT|nr:imidazole glycerol phosphate synthase subunit HisH [Leptospira ainlahdjerensis]MBM9577327.1 imidazole glycerol phosphate synthase subunit HisH [Leptospira ainlahdjerensis]